MATIDGKEYEFKKLGLGRHAKATRLLAMIQDATGKLYTEKGAVRSDTTPAEFLESYNTLASSWKEFVSEVIVDPSGISEYDEIGPEVPAQVFAGFTKAVDGMIPGSSAA